MKLNIKSFSTPREMLKVNVYRNVLDFVTKCEFYKTFSIKLEPSELRFLVLIEGRIECLIEIAPTFGGTMQKCFCGYVKLLSRIKKLLENDPV